MQILVPQQAAATASEHVGAWRTFGELGPPYEVIAEGAPLPDGDRLMRVRLLHTDEELDYPLSEMMADPVAA